LQPLNQKEQAIYQQIKDKPSDLHTFIATRTFFRSLQKVKQKYCPAGNCNFSGPMLAEIPRTSDDTVFAYALDLGEQLDLHEVMMAESRSPGAAAGPSGPVAGTSRAEDAANLARLQPLTPAEQSAYDKIKGDPDELHAFVVTRTVIRAIDKTETEHCPSGKCAVFTDAMLAEIPPTDDVAYTYAFDMREQLLLWTVVYSRQK